MVVSANAEVDTAADVTSAPVNAQRARHIRRNHFGRLVHIGQAAENDAPISDRTPEMRCFRPYFRVPESEESLQRELSGA